DRRELEGLLAELDDGPASQTALIELDARVHRFVHRCSRNPYLARDLDRYLNMSIRIWYVTFDRLPPMRDPIGEHRALLQTIADANHDATHQIALKHMLTFA